jgi:6-phosphogluconolactonase
VRAYRIDPETLALDRINEQSTHGSTPCYLAVDPAHTVVMVANFREFGRYGNAGHRTRGSLCVLPIREDGGLAAASDVRVHEGCSVHPDRQTASHPHGIHAHPDGRWFVVCDLGTDKLYVYELDADEGKLRPAPAPFTELPRPTGPRHLAFTPSGRFALLVSETGASVTALSFDAATGRMERINEVPAAPTGEESRGAYGDVQVHPSGAFAYASLRGDTGIETYSIESGRGRVDRTGFTPMPDCSLDEIRIVAGGEFLLVPCNLGIVSYRIDAGAEALERCGVSEGVPCSAIALL